MDGRLRADSAYSTDEEHNAFKELCGERWALHLGMNINRKQIRIDRPQPSRPNIAVADFSDSEK